MGCEGSAGCCSCGRGRFGAVHGSFGDTGVFPAVRQGRLRDSDHAELVHPDAGRNLLLRWLS